MQASRLLLAAAALTTVAFAAQADDADPSGQFAHPVTASVGAAAPVQAAAPAGSYRVSPWSTQYNPLATFSSSKTRAEVQAEYIRNRDAVAAMNREDSGSAYLAATPRAADASRQLAGQPLNAQ